MVGLTMELAKSQWPSDFDPNYTLEFHKVKFHPDFVKLTIILSYPICFLFEEAKLVHPNWHHLKDDILSDIKQITIKLNQINLVPQETVINTTKEFQISNIINQVIQVKKINDPNSLNKQIHKKTKTLKSMKRETNLALDFEVDVSTSCFGFLVFFSVGSSCTWRHLQIPTAQTRFSEQKCFSVSPPTIVICVLWNTDAFLIGWSNRRFRFLSFGLGPQAT